MLEERSAHSFSFFRAPLSTDRDVSLKRESLSFEGFGLGQRGISVVVSSLIMMSALFGFTTFVLVHKARQGQRRAEGLIDVMRDAEKRQSQLIDFSYASENEKENNLYVYVSNYGWKNAIVENVWVAGSAVKKSDWGVYSAMDDETTDNKLPNRKFTYIRIEGIGEYPNTEENTYAFALLTESDSIYKWEVSP